MSGSGSRHDNGVVHERRELRSGADTRRFTVVRRTDVDLADVPAIVDLHGSGLTPAHHLAVTGAHELVAAGEAVVIAPQAAIDFTMDKRIGAGWAWNIPGAPLPGESTPRSGPDDIDFLDRLIGHVVAELGINAERIHLRGYSGGARLLAPFVAAVDRRLASVTFVSGVRYPEDLAGQVPPVLAIHGARDQINPYAGGTSPRWGESVDDAVRRWAAHAGGVRERATSPAPSVRELRFERADGFAAVRLLVDETAEHTWPGTSDAADIAAFGASGVLDASAVHRQFIREVEAASG
ncbi:hypothetical protein EK0264_04925 [Epidermidibacterium keratini]|uniref:Polyhydroxybutyrate depolymerase n=1 Tax=Epidermidibacterium keratini TaxID=1891644 RepID=A0A7L4YKA8_9ACTN|nr:hypothetical protein [Epidermidibacterium keratini]QHB99694.1 hypothetical protein EK0264_04925 [Epidermidibacterium keratini]